MIRMKPANIFDFFAPTGGGSKIADFKTRKCSPIAPETPPTVSGTIQKKLWNALISSGFPFFFLK